MGRLGTVRIGISGYDYPGWRGAFYPEGVPRRAWLSYASRCFDSIELNGTFYSLKSPEIFAAWASQIPRGFVLAVKGSRFITHNLKLRNARTALGNFFASGILALGKATGPFLWQLPATYRFDPDRLGEFMSGLPRDNLQAAKIARDHDHRLKAGALVEAGTRVLYRHAFEVRHPTYFCDEFYELLRLNKMSLVVADSAGRWPLSLATTARFVYVRLHGSTELYASSYGDAELDEWAVRISAWRADGRDVYVYFDNDAKVHAPHDALRLMERVHENRRAAPGAA
jgi:uncharacterized protein YecE (DUF72 family)